MGPIHRNVLRGNTKFFNLRSRVVEDSTRAEFPHLHIITKSFARTQLALLFTRLYSEDITHTRSARSASELGQVAAHVSCAVAKSRIAVVEPSNHGFPPTLSGNQPLVPPAATSKIR